MIDFPTLQPSQRKKKFSAETITGEKSKTTKSMYYLAVRQVKTVYDFHHHVSLPLYQSLDFTNVFSQENSQKNDK